MMLTQSGRVLVRGLAKQGAVQSRLSSNVAVTMHDKSGVATLTMTKKPVNSLNLEMLTDLNIALDKLQIQKNCTGLIITSNVPKIFSAGLDIMEMYQPQSDRLRAFWSSLQDVWIKLYGNNLPVIAAINGNAPAGGCLLAMACDSRIMAEGPYGIGLNETKLGIVAPQWFQDTMLNTIGHRETERALMLGHMYKGPEALQAGLIDSLVPQEKMQEAVEEAMKQWISIPAAARAVTKHQLRQPIIDKLIKTRGADVEHFVSFITKSSVQNNIGMYLEMLKAQSMKKQNNKA